MAEGGQAAGLGVERGEGAQWKARKRAADVGEHAGFLGAAGGAGGARAWRRRYEAVDDELGDLDAGRGERGDAITRFFEAQCFRQQQPGEAGVRGVAQQRGQPAAVGVELLDGAIGRARAVAAPDALGQDLVLGAQVG